MNEKINTLGKILLDTRYNARPTKSTNFGSREVYCKWKESVKAVHRAIYNYANIVRLSNGTSEEIKIVENSFYSAYKAVLTFFDNEKEGFKLKNEGERDIKTMLLIAGCFRINKDEKEKGQQFLPYGENKFRKSFENIIVDKLINASMKTEEEIEQERKEKAAKRRTEKKVLKETKPNNKRC